MEDGPLEIIPPQELLWYHFYVRNFYIYKDDKLQKAFRQQIRLPYKQYLELLDQIDKDVHCCFLYVFIQFVSTVLYKKWVLSPVNLPKAKSNMNEYTQAGFPGCIGSSNCTHIVTKQCQYNLKNNHIGAKSLQTTRTFI
jgi:hypothetical protein